MPTPPQQPDPGAGRPVRYYPRRIRRPAQPTVLSPSQALHLADDPSRAERARRTAGHRSFVAAPPPQAPAVAAPGRLRRLLHRLTRR